MIFLLFIKKSLFLWKKLVDLKQLDMKYLRLYTLDRYKRRLMYVGNNV